MSSCLPVYLPVCKSLYLTDYPFVCLLTYLPGATYLAACSPFVCIMYLTVFLPYNLLAICLLNLLLTCQLACLPAYLLLCLPGWALTPWRISRRWRHSAPADSLLRCLLLLAGAPARPTSSCLLDSFCRTFAVIVCIRQVVGVNTT